VLILTSSPASGKVDSGGSIQPNIREPEPPTDLLEFGNNPANDLYMAVFLHA
jgi:hypothetical protein